MTPLALVGILAAGCGGGPSSPSSADPTPTPGPGIVDCRASAACPELAIAGDAPSRLPSGAASPFRGFADPSLRHDPATGTQWLAYSWPSLHANGDGTTAPAVSTHLARSDDDGRSFRFVGELWPSTPARDLGGEPGYVDHEVPNLLPVVGGGAVTWFGVRLEYFVPERGGFAARPFDSFRLRLARASSPPALAAATAATLGTARTALGWDPGQTDLSALADAVADCAMWNEPALHHVGDTLYLVVRCLRFEAGVPRVERSDLVVFAAPAGPDVRRYSWRYAGRLASAEEARELGGGGLTQIDLARGRDGRLLAIVSPDDWSETHGEFVHHGCRVVEVDSLDPPRLARDAAGRLRVRAVVTASDQGPLGPGACAYAPTAALGVLLTRRAIGGSAALVASLHSTGLHP